MRLWSGCYSTHLCFATVHLGLSLWCIFVSLVLLNLLELEGPTLYSRNNWMYYLLYLYTLYIYIICLEMYLLCLIKSDVNKPMYVAM